MALRSLGSTLLAKTAPGSQLRTTEEKRSEGAVPNESAQAQPTSTSRELENKPFETATPEGTLKNVATKPNIQDKVSVERSQSPLLAGAMGMPAIAPKTGTPNPVGGARPISAGGAAAPRSEMASTPISAGTNILSQINKADPSGVLSGAERTAYAKQGSQITAPAASSKVEAPNTAKAFSASGFNPIGWLGSRVSASEPQVGDQSFTRSLLQGIAATIGDRLLPKESAAAQNLMSFANNPARSEDTGIMRNLNEAARGSAPSAASNPTIQAMASNVKAAAQPVVNKVSQAAQKVAAPIRSVASQAASNFSKPNVQAMSSNVQAAAKQVASTVSNWLRSLFR